MMFIVRWPVVLILLGLVVLSLVPAALGTIETYNLPVDLGPLGGASENLEQWALSTTMPERVLWYLAALFFFIAAVRLIRRTQGFWVWLLGFACYGGRWALGQHHQEGGFAATIQSVDVQALSADTLAEGGSEAQLGFLVFLLIVGLLVFIIDSADRAYWDRQDA